MAFPSRGCRTCKQRHVKCDEARPVCKRCRKANRACYQSENLIFLNENEYAVGQRKRPRGPNVNSELATSSTPDISQSAASSRAEGITKAPVETVVTESVPTQSQVVSISSSLKLSLEDQAVAYFARSYVELPHSIPEVLERHILQANYSLAGWYYYQPRSVLGLAVLAVSYATFGRGGRNHAALAAGCVKYSNAVAKTNLALRDTHEAVHDHVFIAVMLLCFYENSVTNNTSYSPSREIQDIASRGFAHHDGAMALLELRRQHNIRSSSSLDLDRIIRRQLMRSLLIRKMSVPHWLRNGSQYGEQGLALGLDRLMVIVAKLRNEASCLSTKSKDVMALNEVGEIARLRSLLAEAHVLDDALVGWANDLPPEDWYSINAVSDTDFKSNDSVFDNTVHIYPSVEHAGMWNRFRALRLAVHETMLKVVAQLYIIPEYDTRPSEEEATSRMRSVAEDMCASVPYFLGFAKTYPVGDGYVATVIKAPTSPKDSVSTVTASFLCWPLALTTTIYGIPERQQQYLRRCLHTISEIVDDGMLEQVACKSAPELDGSLRVQ